MLSKKIIFYFSLFQCLCLFQQSTLRVAKELKKTNSFHVNTSPKTSTDDDNDSNSEEFKTYVPESEINVLFLYTKEAVDEFVVACSTTPCDYQDKDVLDELESKAKGYVETLNERLYNSGITHRVSLADPFPNNSSRSIAIIDTSEQDIITITASDSNFQYPDSKKV